MTSIAVYDTEAKEIERICGLNDMTLAELIECLMDYLPDIIEENNLRGGAEK